MILKKTFFAILKPIVLLAIPIVLFQSCYFGANDTFYNRELPDGLRLFAMDEKENLALWEPMGSGGGSFSGVIMPTIYALAGRKILSSPSHIHIWQLPQTRCLCPTQTVQK